MKVNSPQAAVVQNRQVTVTRGISDLCPSKNQSQDLVKAVTSSRVKKSSLIPKNESAGFVRNVVNSAVRALGRQAEAEISFISNNSLIRLPFRFFTETIRNGASTSVENILENKKVDKSVWIRGAKKSLENVAATVLFEPNRYSSSFTRAAVGFANMLVRFAARAALVFLNVLAPDDLNLEGAADESFSRTFGRIIRPFSSNPLFRLASRFFEQVLINFGVDNMPIKNHLIPKLQQKSEKAVTVGS